MTSSDLVILGANHRSSSLDLRDRILVPDAEMERFVERLFVLGEWRQQDRGIDQ